MVQWTGSSVRLGRDRIESRRCPDRTLGDRCLAGSRISGCCTASHPSDHSGSRRPDMREPMPNELPARGLPSLGNVTAVSDCSARLRRRMSAVGVIMYAYRTCSHPAAPRDADPCWPSQRGRAIAGQVRATTRPGHRRQAPIVAPTSWPGPVPLAPRVLETRPRRWIHRDAFRRPSFLR